MHRTGGIQSRSEDQIKLDPVTYAARSSHGMTINVVVGS